MRITSLLFIVFMPLTTILAQYAEVGVQIGLSNYSGELSEQKLRGETFGSLIGAYGKYNFTKYLSARASLLRGEITGDDKFAKSLAIRERNLNFRTEIIELAMTGEVNFSPYNIRAKQTGVPYFFAGLALTYFNPQAQMRGSWYDLQPLRTEGKKYSRYILAIPFGLGMKFNISYKVNFGFEVGARKTFTDYLDDVSTNYPDVVELRKTSPTVAALTYRTPELTGSFNENPVGVERGNPNNNDWYFFGAITVSVNLTDKYGLDFDKKYEIFKDHLKKPKIENANKNSVETKQKKENKRTTKRKRLFKKKSFLEPVVKPKLNKKSSKPEKQKN